MSESVWKDLLAWQKDFNAKDEALIRRKPVHDQALPPVRSSTELVIDNLKPVGLDALTDKKNSPQVKKAPVPPVTPPNKSPQTRAEKAEAEKAKGNEYFVKKDYKNAILYYGKAIDLDPTVPVYFVNRAMAYLKTNSFLEAEKDCTRGIQLQPKNVKALWRRGIALRELGRLNEARKDFEMGLTIEPNNKSIMDELKKLPAAPKTTEKPKPKPVVAEKRRLPINVIDEAYTEVKKTSTKAPVKIEEKVPETKPVTTKKVEQTSSPKITEISSTFTEKKIDPVITTKPVAPSPVKAQPVKFNCPRTNFEFERDWKTYKGRGDDVLYQYFLCIPPTSYATLFKSSLESDQFEKMIELIESRYIKEKTSEETFSVLEGLSLVKRIDMLIMFLGKKHQQAIQSLFDTLKTSSAISNDRLAKTAKIYSARI